MNNQLNREQLDGLKTQLENQFNELWKEIGAELEDSAKERFQQMAGEVRDRGEESLADTLAGLNMTLVDRHKQETREISGALNRIAEGIYGRCEDCDTAIAFNRLSAYPAATRCINCQESYEKAHPEGTQAQP